MKLGVKTIIVILAGGKSSRMNFKNKAYLSYKEKSFIDYIIDSANCINIPYIISGSYSEYPSIADENKEFGPFSGVYTCSKNLIDNGYKSAIFTPVDMPLINSLIFNKLLLENLKEKRNLDAIYFKNNPLPFLLNFTESVIKYFLSFKNKNSFIQQSIKEFLAQINSNEIFTNKLSNLFVNINSLKDYENLMYSKINHEN